MKGRSKRLFAAAILAAFSASLSASEVRPKSDQSKVPWQSEGLWVKTMLEFADEYDRPAYQEIIPCRIVDTREASAFEAPYGGPTLQPGDARIYSLKNLPASNPCFLANRKMNNPVYEDFYGTMMAI